MIKKSHSQRQLYTIKTFGTQKMGKMVIHSGCFGCGKTYSLVEGFGIYCCKLKELGIYGLNFVLLGKTQSAVKKNMCNILSKLYGNDFKYDSSKKSGVVKDAVLFGQNIYIIGLNDTSSESKFRGISDIMGILHDEAVLCTREQFDYIMGRLRGEIDVELPSGFVKQWYIGSTNPDVPTHFILDYTKKGILVMIKWYMSDACWDGSKEYYDRLITLYKDNPSFYSRYLKGKWTSSDRMVYPMFNYKRHVLNEEDIEISYKDFKRSFISIDYGSDHPTAIALISVSWSGEYIITKVCKLRNTAPSDIVNKVALYYNFLSKNEVGCDNIYIDPSAGGLKDELRKAELFTFDALNSHSDGIGYLRNLMALNKFFITSSCDELVSEIYSYRFKDNSSGKDEVIKVGDDLVDSIRYGIYTDHIVRG